MADQEEQFLKLQNQAADLSQALGLPANTRLALALPELLVTAPAPLETYLAHADTASLATASRPKTKPRPYSAWR